MKVSLNNSLCFQMNNRRIGKVNEPGVNGLFSILLHWRQKK